MDRLGAQEGEVISHSLVSRAIGNAQKRVEGRNFEIRKHLKDYDDVMNLQRMEIYGLRQRILRGEDLREEILDQLAASLEEIVIRHTSNGTYPENWDLTSLYADIQTVFGITYRVPETELTSKTQDAMFDEIWNLTKEKYYEKEHRFGELIMRQFERGVFLMVIDNLWKDHLYEMDHLKGGVQYRAFGQKNPLYEYQREGLKMFEEFRSNIAREVSSYIFRLERVQQESGPELDNSRTVHSDFDVFSSPQIPKAPVRAAQPQLVTNRSSSAAHTVVRSGVQVGRNDPCPCGSGKKFKKCCGIV